MMPSTITDRLANAVDGVAVSTSGTGIVRLTSSSGTDNVTVTAAPTIEDWVTDQIFVWRPQATNTGAMTIIHATAGTVSLKTPSGAALSAGQIQSGLDVMMAYNGTELRIIGSGF
jgi:hypothetical protein